MQTGDAQLDRVASINIDQIRDQRIGPVAAGGAAVAPGPNGAPPPNAASAANAPSSATNFNAPAEAPKETPIYKKWWFWAVIAVSAYVVYEIATQGSTSSNSGREEMPLPGGPAHSTAAAPASGWTLLRF